MAGMKQSLSVNRNSVWSALCQPLVDRILCARKENTSAPLYVVENPFPYFTCDIAITLSQLLAGFSVIQWAEDILSGHTTCHKATEEFCRLFGHHEKPLVLLCISRSELPREFRSLITSDHYFLVDMPGVHVLEKIARERHGVSLEGYEAVLGSARLYPQDILAIEPLQKHRWQQALIRLAQQRSDSETAWSKKSIAEFHDYEAGQWSRECLKKIAQAKEKTVPWSDVDRGVLLTGTSWADKKALACTLARESGIGILPVACPMDWHTKNTDCTQLVSATFTQARQSAPCILFLDEIDLVAPDKSHASGETQLPLSSVLYQLLNEWDCLNDNLPIIVIGTAQSTEGVNPALRRAGRFDRAIPMSEHTPD